jgi:hypothetical protein
MEADVRKQGELGAARLNALEAQLARVFSPEPITGKGSRKTKVKWVQTRRLARLPPIKGMMYV